MPKLAHSIPKYRCHRASGQAIVTLGGRDHYLGPWRSTASKAEYDRLIGEWLAAGRNRPLQLGDDGLTIVEMLARFWRHAEQHYRKNGQVTNELSNIRNAVRPLNHLYGRTMIANFGPLVLKALQQEMIRANLSRGMINQRIGIIKRIFRWAESEELAPAGLIHSLDTVAGLRRGRSAARETPPVKPVAQNVVDATLPHLRPVVADMVRFQQLTGCRPIEVCLLRPGEVDRNGDVWEYRPSSHKTEHHGHERSIFIGPRAQAVLLRYMLRPPESFCFSPVESEAARKAALRANRKSKVQPSQLDRSKRDPQKLPGRSYTSKSYLYAVRRACDQAFPPPDELNEEQQNEWRRKHRWHPNQLRHLAATLIRREYGLEAAQVALGHASADVSQIYAERNMALARNVMAQIG